MAFRPHGDVIRVNNYSCATAIRSGAVVTLTSAGLVAESTGATTAILGVALGYADGSTVTTVAVADHPDQEFATANDDNSAFVTTDIGNNCSIVAGTAYMTTESGNRVDHTSKATTSTLPFRITGLLPYYASGTQVGCVVRPNNHMEKTGVTGI